MINKNEIFHNAQVQLIKKHPKRMGLENIALTTSEVVLFDKNGKIFREPDNLMFDPTTHTLYNIEYKTNNTDSAYKKANSQLRTSGAQLQYIFSNWKVVNLYITGNFEVHRL